MINEPLVTTHQLIDFIRCMPRCGFLTVTLKPKFYKYSSVTQLELTNNILYDILYNCSLDFHVVAEHTKQGNVHYHALVGYQEEYKIILMLNKLKKQKEFGFSKWDNEIQNAVKASEYMTKDLYETSKIFTSVSGHRPQYYMTGRDWKVYN